MTTISHSITVAYNINALGLHNGLPYARISRAALDYYIAEGLIRERAERGRFDTTPKGRAFVKSVMINQP